VKLVRFGSLRYLNKVQDVRLYKQTILKTVLRFNLSGGHGEEELLQACAILLIKKNFIRCQPAKLEKSLLAMFYLWHCFGGIAYPLLLRVRLVTMC
jgi:hypothetical protein